MRRDGTHMGCRYKHVPVNHVAAALVAAKISRADTTDARSNHVAAALVAATIAENRTVMPTLRQRA